ncbi:MAG: PQQ-binding-like beta-propeller repeat protein [Sandaracinaceae bacterium]
MRQRMRVIPLHPSPRFLEPDAAPRSPQAESLDHLRQTLLGLDEPLPMPAMPDILSAVLALAEGTRQKSLLPLATAPAELALLRRGDDVCVSYYLVEEPTQVRVLDRPIRLSQLLELAADTADAIAAHDPDPISRGLTLRLAERAREANIEPIREVPPPVRETGGALERPTVPLAFGYEAEVVPVADPPRQATAHSDVHALLFTGNLWMWTRGRRIPLIKGPIMLVVARMVAGVRALVEAHEAGRPANVRLRAGRFVFGVRLAKRGDKPVQLTLGEGGKITVPELTVTAAALPVLRLASDLLRTLVSNDRSQARNLRVSALRDEVRGLRRRLRAKEEAPLESIVNLNPERLRASAPPPRPSKAKARVPSPRSLRFDVRWEAEVEGLDAASTFLCGDRMIIATPKRTVCLHREEGDVLWIHERPAAASFMTGTVLVQATSDGQVTLSEIETGEPYAHLQLAPRVGGPPVGILAGGRSVPPVAVLAEGRDRLVAVDLRTGTLRWRFGARSPGALSLTKAGRILIATSEDGTIAALDVGNGELLWRYAADGAIVGTPAVCGDVVVLAARDALVGVDLFSGRETWKRELDARPACAPMAAAHLAAIAIGEREDMSLAAFDPSNGELRWMVPDPGAGRGAACLAVDQLLIVNAPAGHLEALSLDDGRVRWERRVSHPVADDVPRRLEPVLRGGALFVPSAAIHVARPGDGSAIGEALPCELVPDWMRVDERGWVYVAEESGHLAALAPRPHLSLVR